MERYREYKNSGVYYIPQIPSEWNVLKGKILFKQEKRPVNKEDEIVTCFRDGEVTLRKNRRLEGFTNSLKEIGYQGIRKGDLLIHNMDAFAGAIGVSDSDGKGTPVYAVCTPIREDANQFYYCYLLRFLAKTGFIQSLAKGIRERSTDFRYGDFKELLLPVPSRAEQDAIVRYLDSATSEIDKAIAMQQKMIDLLNERKQIIIQNAVTKGLDENVEMKESGVEWIGRIPKHWEVEPFSRHFTFGKGLPITKANLQEDGIAVISYGQIHAKNNLGTTLTESLVRYVSPTYIETHPQCLLKGNDFIFADTSEDIEGSGNFAFNDFDNKIFAGYHTVVARPNDLLFPKYYAYLFKSKAWKSQIQSLVNGVKVYSIGRRILKTSMLLIPSEDEQKNIVRFLDKQTSAIEKTIETISRQITLLQERKQIIINEVVTGKVRVS